MNNGKNLNEDIKDQTPHFEFNEVNNQLKQIHPLH